MTVTVNESAAVGGNTFKNWIQKQMLFLGYTFFYCQLFAEKHQFFFTNHGPSFQAFVFLICKSSLEQQIFKTHLKMFSKVSLRCDWSAPYFISYLFGFLS